MAKLLKSTSIVGGMTMISRLLGFVRDMIFAAVFGAGPAFDAFIIAFKIPNFFRRLFGEGAFSQAFVPVLAEYSEQQGEEATRQFVARIAGSLGLVLLLIVVVSELLAPLFVMIFAPGFNHDATRYMLAKHMLHITFPYLMLISLTAFSGAILNTFNKFAVPAFTPVLLNVVLIASACWLAPHFAQPIYAIAWGVLIAGVIQLAIQLPFLKKAGLLPRPIVAFRDPGVRRVMKMMVPALFGVSVVQISLLVDNFFASFLPAGSISWLYYSDRLTYLPLGVIGVALATVVLPNLSRQYAKGSHSDYAVTLRWGLRWVWLMGLPAALALLILSGPLLATLIHRGAFNNFDVLMTQRSLMAFSIGLPAFMLIKVLASAFYAQKNIKTPVKIACVALLANIILNFLLIHPLAHAGLALSSSLAAMLNSAILWIVLWRRGVFKSDKPQKNLVWRIVLAAIVMLLVLWYFTVSTNTWLAWHEVRRIACLSVLIVAGLFSYFGTLWLSGVRWSDLKGEG